MAAITRTYTFTDGTTAYGSQVETEISTIVSAWNNHDAGTSSWTKVKISSSETTPLDVISSGSTTVVSIDNTATDGDPQLVFKLSGSALFTFGVDDSDSDFFKFATTGITTNVAMQIPTGGSSVQFADGTKTICAVGNIGDADTGIYWGAANTLNVSCNDTDIANFAAAGFTLASGQMLSVNGSQANPSYSFSNFSTTGLLAATGPEVRMSVNNTLTMDWSATRILVRIPLNPNGAGAVSSGDGSDYWNDISYKTLTDRGCLGWFDEGVELQDGTIVSDCDAIASIKKHPVKKTIYGVPMLDYKSFPKVAFKKAQAKGELLQRDENDDPIGGSDGIEMTSMQSIMIGAIKELHKRVASLEKK